MHNYWIIGGAIALVAACLVGLCLFIKGANECAISLEEEQW